MSDCGCYLAHGAQHLCAYHEIYIPTRSEEDLWVEAELCRECICDELERLESQLARTQARLRKARAPREWLPPETSPFVIGHESSDGEEQHDDDDDPELHPRDGSNAGSFPEFF